MADWAVKNAAWLLAICLAVSITFILFLIHAATHSPYTAEGHQIGDTSALTLDASKRSILSRGDHTCAEPSPDASATIATEIAANVSAAQAGDEMQGMVQLLTSAGIEKLFERTQGIQAIRDGMFRLCEANMNDGISPDFYEEEMIDLVTTLNFIVPLELCMKAALDFHAARIVTKAVDANHNEQQHLDENGPLPETIRTADQFMRDCSERAFRFGLAINEAAALRLQDRRRAAFELAQQQLQIELFLREQPSAQ